MARPNRPRRIGASEAVAQNIRILREDSGWSPASLAARMTQNGCPIHRSAIYKIESGMRAVDPDELVAFASLFDVSVDAMVSAPEWSGVPREVKDKVELVRNAEWQLVDARDQLERAKEQLSAAKLSLTFRLAQFSDVGPAVLERLLLASNTPQALREHLAGQVAS